MCVFLGNEAVIKVLAVIVRLVRNCALERTILYAVTVVFTIGGAEYWMPRPVRDCAQGGA
jgi:hypothetical protein